MIAGRPFARTTRMNYSRSEVTFSVIPGSLVHWIGRAGAAGQVRFGHASGRLQVGAEAMEEGGRWVVFKVMMSRSAQCLMEGRA